MTEYSVYLAPEAEDDIVALHRYLSERESINKADVLLDELEEQILSLHTLPGRGHQVPELKRLNICTYRELHHKQGRIIYEINGEDVFVHAVLDMRRSLQDILMERLLR